MALFLFVLHVSNAFFQIGPRCHLIVIFHPYIPARRHVTSECVAAVILLEKL